MQCDKCELNYNNRSGLLKHLRLKHPVEKFLHCKNCDKGFVKKKDLVEHSKVHLKPRIQCSHCLEYCLTYSQLHKHLKNVHDINITVEEHTFEDFSEFEQWKNRIERINECMYSLDTGKKTLMDGKVRMYYACHRSYMPRIINSQERKRSIKDSGSNKIGFACPSRMTVSSGQVVEVTYYPEHMGHSTELGKIKLPNEDRNKIAGKLAEGVTMNRILKDVRTSIPKSGIERIHLINKRDLHNIKRDFSINYSTRKHENDAVSLKLWVEEMKMQTDNPVLFYKGQDMSDDLFKPEDFILIIMTEFQEYNFRKFSDKICIDGTHGLYNYNFELFTLLVIDEFGSGIPVAFCFSNRADTELFNFFFQCLKERVGLIEPNVFMSDDAPAFYNAWQNIMTQVEHQLMCSWHVNKNWTQNLNKIADKEKRQLVSKTLHVLKTEVDKEKFVCGIDVFINDLLNDSDTKEFGDYFLSNYLNRVEKWAYCYRHYIGLNTNMYLESLHKTIKHCYLEGKQCRRLDKSINALLELVRDKMFDKIIKYSKNKSTPKISKIKDSHKKSISITKAMVTVISENEWEVKSVTKCDMKYDVKKISTSCLYNCQLRCSDCDICVHSFKCTCKDNLISFNICKHIHSCVQTYKPTNSGNPQEPIIKRLNEVENIETFILQGSSETVTENEHLKNEIKARLEIILGINERTNFKSKEQAEKIIKDLDNIITNINQEEYNFPEKSKLNVNKNIDPQLRLYSTKKIKTKPNLKYEYPSRNDITAIDQHLSGNQTKIINIHSTFDHAY